VAEAYESKHDLVDLVTTACPGGIPKLVAVQGYSAGPLDAEIPEEWILVYLDITLQRWMLVRGQDIVASHEVKDDSLPFGGYHAMLVRTEAPCRYGTGPYAVQQAFLAGDFMTAGDFEDSGRTGGTYAPRSGLLCDVSTPACGGRTPHC
jgi:hypothetical protein